MTSWSLKMESKGQRRYASILVTLALLTVVLAVPLSVVGEIAQAKTATPSNTILPITTLRSFSLTKSWTEISFTIRPTLSLSLTRTLTVPGLTLTLTGAPAGSPPIGICVIQLGVKQADGTVVWLPGYGYPGLPTSQCAEKLGIYTDMLGRMIVIHQFVQT